MADISNIKQLAKTLNLSNIAKGKISLANQDKRTLDFIESMFLQEIEFRRKNRIKLLKENSNLPNLKFRRNKLQDGLIWQIDKIEKLEFIPEFKNIIITGTCNKGKTSLAVEICTKAIVSNNKVLYLLLDEYLEIMRDKDIGGRETKKYRDIKSSDILVLDDFLYLKLTNEDMVILYKTLLSINESHSIIIISNRKIQNFVDAVEDKFLMNTLVDRLKNNSHLIIL